MEKGMSASRPPEELELLVNAESFRRWANSIPEPRYGEWECEYEDWPALRATVLRFVYSVPPEAWSGEAVDAVLYAVTRDNEVELLADELVERPEALRATGRALAASAEADAKWQVGSRLAGIDGARAIPLLSGLELDSDEYVSRRALLEFGRLRAPVVEHLVDRAWQTGHEYQRIAALHALADSGSARLRDFLELAEQDGRNYLADNAKEIKARFTTAELGGLSASSRSHTERGDAGE